MQLRDTKFGYLKHAAIALVFILACELTIHAEPISLTSILVSLAISAALTAASIGLQMLMQPKPKPQDKNRLQGDIQITHTGEDIPITEIGGAALGDGIGGIKVGGAIIHVNPIRVRSVIIPGQSTGGKGAPKPPPQREYHYYIDLVIMVGRGPLRVKRIMAQQDIIYQDFNTPPQLSGTGYEAEDSTSDSGGTTEVADPDMSGGLKVNLDQNEWLQWNNIVATATDVREIYIVYKSSQDIDIEFTVNGTVYREVLPDSFGIRSNVDLPRELLLSGANTIRIKNMTNAVLSLDRIVVGELPIFIDPGDPIDPPGCYLSGAKYEGWTNSEPTFDPYVLRDVYARDDRGCELWNYQSNRNPLGELSAPVTGNGNVRIYPGNQTQLPDPMLQEYFEAQYGAGATPAYRGRCYVVLENFEITKYGTVPNFTFVAEHETINSLGELYDDLADRVGLAEEEYDFSDLYAVPLRGYGIFEKRAPSKTMEILGRVFDIDVYEDFDGVIKGVIPSETVAVTIPVDELGSVEGKDPSGNGDEKPFTPVITNFRDETELPYFLDVSYFDPSKDYEVRNVHALREVESNDRKANIETGLVMTESEAQKFAERDLHKQYVEKDGIEVSAFHKYSYLAPTNLIRVTDTDGTTQRLRIKAMEGWIPGALKIQGVSRDADEFPERVFVFANPNPVVPTIRPPAPIIGTFIDLATFREETTAGFYAVAALTDTHYQWQGAGLLREIEDDWEALDGIPNQGVMGLTVSGADGTLGDPPAPPFPTIPASPVLSWSPTGGSIAIAKSRKFRITYYDGVDESLPSGITPIVTEGSTSTITVTSPVAATGATHYRVYVQHGGALFYLQNGAGTPIGTDLTLTSLVTGTGQPPSIWDDTNDLTLDLYYGELETLTDEQVLEGRNFLVVGDEIIQFGVATRDNGFPNRWVISHFQRGVRDTLAAAGDHTASERVVLYTEAWRWITQDPGLANISRIYKFVASGDDLEKAWSTAWNWSGRTQFNTSVYATVDNGVPVLDPDPPTLAIEGDFLRVFIKRPIQYGYTADRAEIRVRADDDNAVIRVQETAGTDAILLTPTEDADVDYRWQNRYRGETQDTASDGWSEWSTSAFFDFGTPPPPPPPTNPGGDPPGPGDLEPIGCFIDGTLVLMADWSEKRIEEITTRDYVMAWNHAGRILPGRVIDTMTKEMSERRDLVLSDDRIGVTETHPFLPDFERKMRVKDMESGQKLKSYRKGWNFVEVVSAEPVPGPVKVNNLEVDVWHSYFVRQNGDWKAVYNLSAKQSQSTY